jgi:hypothetical protein
MPGYLAGVLIRYPSNKAATIARNLYLSSLDKNVSAQLALSGVISTFNKPFSGAPKHPRGDTKDDGKNGDNRFAVSVNKLSEAKNADFRDYQEMGLVLLEGLCGFAVVLFAYAGLKRW